MSARCREWGLRYKNRYLQGLVSVRSNAEEISLRILQDPVPGILRIPLGWGYKIHSQIQSVTRVDGLGEWDLFWSIHLITAIKNQGVICGPLAGSRISHPPDLGEWLIEFYG